MNEEHVTNRFYFKMGLLLLALVIAGFGSAAVMRGSNPAELPLIYHLHGLSYLLWFSLFILQANLIGKANYALHKKLGYASMLVFASMVVSAILVTTASYERGTSPVPGTSMQQFLAFPVQDILGLMFFYTMGVLTRGKALLHKHCMLMACIAIMDPALARMSFFLGFPPLTTLLHVGLVGLVIFHDRRTAGKVHPVTWMGLAFVILRVVFIFTVAATPGWESLMDRIFG